MTWIHWIYSAAILIGIGVVIWWWYDNQKKNGPYDQATTSMKDLREGLKPGTRNEDTH